MSSVKLQQMRECNLQMAGPNIAIFASGTGSNFEVIAHADLDCNIALLVCDKPNAPVIQKAEKFGIETLVLEPKQFLTKAAYEEKVLFELKKRQVSWVFLAGYMRLIGNTLLSAYPKRIVNIHPSLLPDFPGKDAVKQAFDRRVETTGVTVHYVDQGMDTGPVIAQRSLNVEQEESLESLTERIHAIEHSLYPDVIRMLLEHEDSIEV